MNNNCTHCGKKSHASDNFCAGCGRPIKEAATPQLAEVKYEQALERLEARLGGYPIPQKETRWIYTLGWTLLSISSLQITIGYFSQLVPFFILFKFIFQLLFFVSTAIPLIISFMLPPSKQKRWLLGCSLSLLLLSFLYIFL